MKKQLLFIDLKGCLYDYVKPIYRKNKTRDNDIIGLNDTLNTIIKAHAGKEATSGNCKKLWYELTETFKNTEIQNKQTDAYKELITSIDNIGKDIAYISPRKGLQTLKTVQLEEITFNGKHTEEDKIEAIKKYLIYVFEYAKDIKEEDNIDYDYYLTISDKELLEKYEELLENYTASHKENNSEGKKEEIIVLG